MDWVNPIVTILLGGAMGLLAVFGIHRLWILLLYQRVRHAPLAELPVRSAAMEWPTVTVQLPLYNEKYVVERLIESVCALDYPCDRLEIQILDDSTDETSHLIERKVKDIHDKGIDVVHLKRSDRKGYKAGALAYGLEKAKGDFVAIFDADFVPPKDFLKKTIPYFRDVRLGMIQSRWGHLNEPDSLLTGLQAMFLDAHFLLEHTVRNRTGSFFNFNGTAGVWRRSAIESAGGWQSDTLTEDLDISYRAQLAGWRFLYLPDLVCPAELPSDMHAFKTQQHRWTAGAVQTARKILSAVWKSRFPLRVKTEATFHLSGSLCYVLIGMVSLLWPLGLFLEASGEGAAWRPAGRWVLWGTLGATFVYYAVSTRILHPDWVSRASRFPLLVAFGAGMCWTHIRAVYDGLSNRIMEFRRTAKYAPGSQDDFQKRSSYRSHGATLLGMEWVVSLYFLAGVVTAWRIGAWHTLPFLAIFLFGNLYVGVLGITHAGSRKEV